MQKKYKITVDGREYNVTVEDLSEGGSLLYPEPGSMNIPAPRAALGDGATSGECYRRCPGSSG